MKTSLYPIFILFVISSCTNSQKLIDKGKYTKAYTLLSKKLSQRRIQKEDVQSFEHLCTLLKQKEEQQLQELYDQKNRKKWPRIYEFAIEIRERQRSVQIIESKVLQKGFGISIPYIQIQDVIDLAATESASLFYDQAEKYFNTADRKSVV